MGRSEENEIYIYFYYDLESNPNNCSMCAPHGSRIIISKFHAGAKKEIRWYLEGFLLLERLLLRRLRRAGTTVAMARMKRKRKRKRKRKSKAMAAIPRTFTVVQSAKKFASFPCRPTRERRGEREPSPQPSPAQPALPPVQQAAIAAQQERRGVSGLRGLRPSFGALELFLPLASYLPV